MSDELYFDDELKKCLITSAFPDCLRDWWYQRIHRAHDASVDRVTDTQRAENAKLRELVQYIYDECYGDGWFNEQAKALGFEPNY